VTVKVLSGSTEASPAAPSHGGTDYEDVECGGDLQVMVGLCHCQTVGEIAQRLNAPVSFYHFIICLVFKPLSTTGAPKPLVATPLMATSADYYAVVSLS